MEHRKSSPQREIYSITGLPQETNKQKSSNKCSNFTLKGIGKSKAQSEQKKGNNKDQSRINEIEAKKQYKRSMKPRIGSLK